MKIKIFVCDDDDVKKFEDEINKWLKKTNFVRGGIFRILQSESRGGASKSRTITFLYED